VCKEVVNPVLCADLTDVFVDTTVTLQDTDKGLCEDIQQDFVTACSIELSVLTLNILFGERVYILVYGHCSLCRITHDIFLWWYLTGSLYI
jgi:hypothetical protein